MALFRLFNYILNIIFNYHVVEIEKADPVKSSPRIVSPKQ